MRFKRFDTQQEALNYSEELCKKHNCCGVTKYLYDVKQAIDGWYLLINDDIEISGEIVCEPKWNLNDEKQNS